MVITPLHISEEVSSLSAIMLNDDYYKFMLSGREVVDDIGVLDAEHLIPFKMVTWFQHGFQHGNRNFPPPLKISEKHPIIIIE